MMRRASESGSSPAVAATVEVASHVPPASWLAVLEHGSLTVKCGVQVERRSYGVFEGVWAGPFDKFDFDLSEDVFGSGVRLRDGGVVFVAPSHTIEALYLHEHAGRLVVSNSLAFLLEHEGIQLSRDVPICRRLATVVLGMERHEDVLSQTEGGRVSRLVNASLIIDDDGSRIVARDCTRRFVDFASYRDHLRDTLAHVASNAREAARSVPFDLLTTVSSGYDSAACAAFAAELGCRDAVTLVTGRSGRSDSGRMVAEALGLTVHEFDALPSEAPEVVDLVAEFMASGFGGEDLRFAAFEPLLRGRVLLTGFHGDKIWGRDVAPNRVLARGDLSGSTMVEFRLRLGFAHVPVPFIAAMCHPDIARISKSDELLAYSTGNAYDRPIARRIVEEAGVPRAHFGQRKEMVSVLGFVRTSVLPQAARATLGAYGRRHGTWRTSMDQGRWYVRMVVGRLLRRALRLVHLGRLLPAAERSLLGDDWRVFEHAAPVSAEMAFRWGLARNGSRYRHSDDGQVSGIESA